MPVDTSFRSPFLLLVPYEQGIKTVCVTLLTKSEKSVLFYAQKEEEGDFPGLTCSN